MPLSILQPLFTSPGTTPLPRLVEALTSFNSHTFNPEGVNRAGQLAAFYLEALGAKVEFLRVHPATEIDPQGNHFSRPLGDAVKAVKRPEASRRILLSIHLDTVHLPSSPFVTRMEGEKLIGPGVVDAKGGLVVLLDALRQFETTNPNIGWEVLLNPDEEIGSPSSAGLLAEAASRCKAGLVFEPSFPDGNLVSSRKGSGTYTLIVRGKTAHAGRDFKLGRNAIVAAAPMISALDGINRSLKGVIVNVGIISGGTAPNVVPDYAILRVNVRVESPDQIGPLEQALRSAVASVSARDGIRSEIHGGITSPPKPFDEPSARMMALYLEEARGQSLFLNHRPSGGTCDGNKLAAYGLPVLDSLGPTGGNLHTDQEYVVIPSLEERATLAARLLMRLATE